MNDGIHEYYTIQFQVAEKNDWCKPDSILKPVNSDEWSNANPDSFRGPALSMLKDGLRKQEYHNHKVYVETGCTWGWYDFKLASEMLYLLRLADNNGKYGYFDGYKNYCQSVRHRFRLIRLNVTKKTTVI